MTGTIEPRRVRVEFTYEADPLVVVDGFDAGRTFKVQRLIISVEQDDVDGTMYIEADAWGRRLTKAGREDRRTGLERWSPFGGSPTIPHQIPHHKVQTFVDDAERRYRLLVQ